MGETGEMEGGLKKEKEPGGEVIQVLSKKLGQRLAVYGLTGHPIAA